MKRTKTEWSSFVDVIEGPCAVCGKEVRFVIPSDRPDPTLLYHSTCEMMPIIRENLKKVPPPPLMPAQNVIVKPAKPAPVAVTPAAAVPAPSTPPPTISPK